MNVGVWISLCFSVLIIVWSLRMRTDRIRNKLDAGNPSTSPLSQAIQELVSTAGGIYLSMIALISFLKIDIPEKVTFLQVSFDPLAFIAIAIAVLQPIVLRILIKKKGD